METIDMTHGVRILIEHDQNAESPSSWDNIGQVAYRSSFRNLLGSEGVSYDRMQEIELGIKDGSLIGLPVFAYIHGGVALSTGSFGCPWDSGQSGFAYMTRTEALAEWGTGKKKVMSAKVREAVETYLKGQVETWSQYLNGEVFYYAVEAKDEDGDWETLDSCGGCYGFTHCKEEATASAEYQIEQIAQKQAADKLAAEAEAVEVAYWADRDVLTEVE